MAAAAAEEGEGGLTVRGFPNSREWWNPQYWEQATAIAARISATAAPPIAAEVKTGFGCWLQLMAHFPQLREVNIHRTEGHFTPRNNKDMLKQEPGEGHDMFLQHFTWDESVVGMEFDVPRLRASQAVLYRGVWRCTGNVCGDSSHQ